MREGTLKLSYGPVELVGANSLEFVELGPEDSKVEVMTKIDPHENEQGKVWAYERVVEVV